MEMSNWKTAYKKESYGDKSFGIEVRVAVDRPLNDNDSRAMYRIADQIEMAIMGETMRLDPKAQETKEQERKELIGLFGTAPILVEEIPNGYCSQWCCTQLPWYKVTTKKGVITLGWRKRVIQISWEARNNPTAEALFPEETSTKFDRTIHAWGIEKAQQYITALLNYGG
jgi:hypothetical protein